MFRHNYLIGLTIRRPRSERTEVLSLEISVSSFTTFMYLPNMYDTTYDTYLVSTYQCIRTNNNRKYRI